MTRERSVVLIAYYLAFCLLCCACLLGVMRRERNQTEDSDRAE